MARFIVVKRKLNNRFGVKVWTYSYYVAGAGWWSDRQDDALKFESKIEAQFVANEHNGAEVEEVEDE